jgi:hypothetical protein
MTPRHSLARVAGGTLQPATTAEIGHRGGPRTDDANSHNTAARMASEGLAALVG